MGVFDSSDVDAARSDWMRGIYPLGVVCGLLMSVCVYWMRNWDMPVPLPVTEAVLVIPCAVLSGLVIVRGGVAERGMAAGAATATTGHVTVVVAAVLYGAVTGSWLLSLAAALTGAALVPLPLMLGATFGALGAVLGRVGR